MNSSNPKSPDGPVDPEALLHSRLRDTTPEFEARFDDLRRRLAREPSRPAWRESLASWLRLRGALAGLAAAAVVAVLAVMLVSRGPGRLAPTEMAAFGELVVLDDTLREALAITDAETLEALLLIPIDPEGHS